MVLDGGAAQRQPVGCLQEAGSFGGLTGCVLDRLGFIENDVMKGDLLEEKNVAPQDVVSGDDEICALDLVEPGLALRPGVVDGAELGCESFRFLEPVENEGARHDHQVGLALLRRDAVFLQNREDLDGFAEAHIVR